MALKEDFETAARDVQTLIRRPDNESLLSLYSLYKQASEGDVSGPRPGIFDLKGRAKYDAWAGKKGMAREQAMQDYIALVRRLLSKFA